MLRTLIIIKLTFIAFIAFNMGMDWINFGPEHGLHPAMALPLALVTFIGAFIVPRFIK